MFGGSRDGSRGVLECDNEDEEVGQKKERTSDQRKT